MSGQVIRIAVVRSLDGITTTCGPNDCGEYNDQMEAAICYHIEGGHTPADKAWIVVTLPSVNEAIPEFAAYQEQPS